jgi:type III restriction enzyme
MARTKKPVPGEAELFDITAQLRTAACVPAIRQAVADWRAAGYPGTTNTTKLLFNHWFNSDHRLKNGRPFSYHASQREAIESLVFVWEIERVWSRKGLLERYSLPEIAQGLPLPKFDDFARYCLKMATGSGKTKVMSLAIAWQFFNAMAEKPEIARHYAKSFLVIAPNIIVLERLSTDFANGRIFRDDPIIPRSLEIYWEMQFVMRGDGERAGSEGSLFLTNIQQLYPREEKQTDSNPITDLLGPTPPTKATEGPSFADRIGKLGERLMVINDEAHHTWDENSEWNSVIRSLHSNLSDPRSSNPNPSETSQGLSMQLDMSATPRFQKGVLFPWIIFDYPLKQAIMDSIVKRPVKGVTKAQEARSEIASVKYQAYLTAGVERWREYREQLSPLGKKPVLFVMMNNTIEADDVGDWLRTKYPSEFAGDGTLVIHTDTKGEITKKDLDAARKASREIDDNTSPVNAVVSVMMLREGWDVQNVNVVVGLRPYTAKANILPEQAIGRGLRLMFRGSGLGYTERVDIIGNGAFLEFVEDLEKLEEVKLESFELGKDKLKILVIRPEENKMQFDIAFPVLSPALIRKKSLASEIASLDLREFQHHPLPLKQSSQDAKAFKYEGKDIITLETLVEREYQIPDPQTAQEVIGFYARVIAQRVKLPGQFSVIAPKVREWFETYAFGKAVDLNTPEVIKAMGSNVANYICCDLFIKALAGLAIEEQTPEVLAPSRMLSNLEPFPWSRQIFEANKSVLNFVPCENEFERAFAKFLDAATDVRAMCKVPDSFGFTIEYTDGASSLRNYYPDFVAVDEHGTHWLIETKGAETEEVSFKDRAASTWCENASSLTGIAWRYLKVKQTAFKKLQPDELADLMALV